MRDLVSSVPSYGRVHVGARCGVDARIAPPFMEATDASRLVCVVVVSYQGFSLSLCFQENDATEEEMTRERTTRVGRPRGGMKVAARSGERLRKEIGRGRLPRVGDG